MTHTARLSLPNLTTERAHTWREAEGPIARRRRAEIVDPLTSKTWDETVRCHPGASIFHSSAWAKVLAETYGHRPVYLRLNEDDEASALLPLMEIDSRFTGRRGISLPFSDLCSPLLSGDYKASQVVAELHDLARERKWDYFQLRGASFLHGSAPAAVQFHAHVLDLRRGTNGLLKACASNIRRNLQKAERSGVTAQVLRTREAVLKFYALHARTRTRHGAPPQPLKFFLKIYEEIIEAGLGFIVLAERRGHACAGAVFFQFGGNAVFKFGASDERFQEYRGNNVAMWQGIRFLSEAGLAQLHLGRTALSNEGLRRFKLAWGADEEMLEYFSFVTRAHRWETGSRKLAERTAKLFRRLPVAANRLLGAMLYPHLD